MRLIRNILLILLVLGGFALGLGFVSANGQTVTLDLLLPAWQMDIALGWLVLLVLLAGLLVGLLAGLGVRAALLARRGRA